MAEKKEKHPLLPVFVEGVVEPGQRLGRRLGFPTANQSIDAAADIPRGIYASTVEIDGESYPAVSNVGIRPTVSGGTPNCESHILGFSGDLYGSFIKTTLCAFLREERSFESLDELKKQIELDAIRAREYFCETKKTTDKD